MGYITVSNQFGDMGKREIPKFSMAILIRKQLGFDPQTHGAGNDNRFPFDHIFHGPQCP